LNPRGSSLEAGWAMFNGLSLPGADVSLSGVQSANGFSVLTNPGFCVERNCRGVLMVSHGGVVWFVQVVTRGTSSQAQDYLDSFRPLG
jgi:hypothetical protein